MVYNKKLLLIKYRYNNYKVSHKYLNALKIRLMTHNRMCYDKSCMCINVYINTSVIKLNFNNKILTWKNNVNKTILRAKATHPNNNNDDESNNINAQCVK